VAVTKGGEQIYAGTSTGHLLEFRATMEKEKRAQESAEAISRHSTTSTPHNNSIRLAACKSVGKKPVQGVCVLAEAKKVVVLCGGLVVLLECESMEATPLPSVKAARWVGFNHDGRYPARLMVGMKRKVLLYEVRAGPATPSSLAPAGEVELQDSARAAVWNGAHMVVGSNRNYSHLTYPLSSPRPSEICSFPEDPHKGAPYLASLPRSAEAVLVLDTLGVITDMQGQPTGSSIPFSSRPLSLAQSSPYILAAMADGSVEVYDRGSARLVQRLPLQMLPATELHLADDLAGQCVVAAVQSRLVCLLPVPLEEQVRELLRAKQLDEAAALVESAVKFNGCPVSWIETVRVEAAYLLIFDLEFERAMSFLQQCSAFQPGELFAFFPQFALRWMHVVQPRRYWGLHPPPQDIRSVIHSAIKLKRHRMTSMSLVARAAAPVRLVLTSEQEQAQVQAVLAHATASFAKYMDWARSSRHLERRQEHREGIDTLLAHLYLSAHDVHSLEAMLKLPNSCNVAQLLPVLREAGRHHAAALLLESCGREHEAVAVWAQLVQGECQEAPSDQGEVCAEGARSVGIREAARVLACSGDARTILQHMPMFLADNSDYGLQVLTSERRQVPLPIEELLVLLRRRRDTLRRRFLEHLVASQGVQDADRHTELARCLLEELLESTSSSSAGPSSSNNANNVEDEVARAPQARATLADCAPDAPGGCAEPRRRFQSFLRTSQRYEVETILNDIRGLGLWEEEVILLSKLRDHRGALGVIVLNLRDFSRAETYCSQWHDPGEAQVAYMSLLEMYLNPPDASPPLFKEAMRLLSTQNTFIDPVQVLDSLSADTPLELAVAPLQRILRERMHLRYESQMMRALHKAKYQATSTLLVQARSQQVCMTQERVCRNCHVRLSGRADGQQVQFFAVYPNGCLVCYRCLQLSGEHVCPVTHRDFRISPALSSGEITPTPPT